MEALLNSLSVAQNDDPTDPIIEEALRRARGGK
ncbi:hypothetical protein HEP81_08077 (plasmid) [Streptomyces griseofuscus]|uniref:Uncharacterized protein n=1 Tax=Streptomyces griseofuscus TaxID=146922 RepID=A0A7H1QDC5_9ACTN|nr:hypothetical protein HEP81_08077 [Streptomyces griseofuscus]